MADNRRIGETVLITGASAGIGREIAKEFASRGYNLVLVARSEGKLQDLARELAAEFPITARVLPADLSTPDGPSSVFRALAGEGIAIDILVNNAGIMHYSPFVEQGTEKSLDIVRLNVVALTAMTSLSQPVATWSLIGVIPIKWTGPQLSVDSPKSDSPFSIGSQSSGVVTASRAMACDRAKFKTSRVGMAAPERPSPMRASVKRLRSAQGSAVVMPPVLVRV